MRVFAFHACSVFTPKSDTPEGREKLRATCLSLGAADLIFRDQSPSLIERVKAPAYGHGRNLNPCLDCHIDMLRLAAETMGETGAEFLATGEVLGQRPKSQRRDALATVDRHVRALGLTDRLVRPLSAKLLEPTLPEREGWIDREGLQGISGRGRKPQMALAVELGIGRYESPAGGCLLTDPGFCARLGDLMRHLPTWGADDARLLRAGRHFRLSPGAKAVVSRREEENTRLLAWGRPGDLFFLTVEKPGAIVMLRGERTAQTLAAAAGLAVWHSRHRAEGRAAVHRREAGIPWEERELLAAVDAVDPAGLVSCSVEGGGAAAGAE